VQSHHQHEIDEYLEIRLETAPLAVFADFAEAG